MDARRRRSIKKTSLRQERQTAADVGGRTQANSGAVRMGGGADVRAPGTLRIECKFTEKDRYVLKLVELEKLRKQAIKTLEFPVFQFAYSFHNSLTKYAVTPWNKATVPNLMDTHRWLGLGSIIIRHDELKKTLSSYKLLLVELDGKTFQIQHWDDFIKQFQGPENFSMGCVVATAPCAICECRACEHLGGKEEG